MAVGVFTQFQIVQGRRDEALKVLAEAKAVTEQDGAVVRVRQTVIGGETSGNVSYGALFEDGLKHAEFVEKMIERGSNPLMEMLNAADPPALAISRAMANEITPKPRGIQPSSRVSTAVSLRVSPGQQDVVLAVLAEAQDHDERLGASVSVWRVAFAGANSGTIAFLRGFESWKARAEFAEKMREARGGPSGQLVRSGAVSVASSSISVEAQLP